MESFWVAEDERGLESVHQFEPTYNRLQRNWVGGSKVYVGKGFITNGVTEFDKGKVTKAYAIEVEPFNNVTNKAKVIRVVKIY